MALSAGSNCSTHGSRRWPAWLVSSAFEVLYWLHQSRRDLLLQSPANDGVVHGTFSLRSPVRPNPIGTSIVSLIGIEGSVVLVQGLDCLDGTPLLDLKPDRTLFTADRSTTARGRRGCLAKPLGSVRPSRRSDEADRGRAPHLGDHMSAPERTIGVDRERHDRVALLVGAE